MSLPLLVGGCSDSDNTSSGTGAASAPTTTNSPFAGTYSGTATVTLSALGRTVRETTRGDVVVRKNGTVAGSILGGNADLPCTTTVAARTVSANGTFVWRETGSCDLSDNGFGTCDVDVQLNGDIAGNRLNGNGPVSLDCGLADATGSIVLSAAR